MQVTKSLYASLVSRTIRVQSRNILGIGVVWPFSLESSDPILEPDFWKAIGDSLAMGIPIDSCIPKEKSEFLVSGAYYAPNALPVTEGAASVRVGALEKQLYVVGDRYWRKGSGLLPSLSDPEPFTTLPITYDYAFGGTEYAQNPLGKGLGKGDDGRLPLPNIEYADHIITAPSDTPPPAGFSPLAADWAPRVGLGGTYDGNYGSKYFPGFPDDLDFHYFNDAPKDQWLDGHWQGGEAYLIKNMHPEKASIEGFLPRVNARVIVEQKVEGELRKIELPTRLDTVWFFPDKMIGALIHHASIEVEDPLGLDVTGMLLSHEAIGQRQINIEVLEGLIDLRKDPNQGYKILADTALLIPENIESSEKQLVKNADFPSESLAKDAGERYMDAQKSRAESVVAEGEEKLDQPLAHITAAQDEDIAKLRAISEKIIPTNATDPSKVDLASIDLSALDELKENAEEYKAKQDVAMQEKLQTALEEARKSDPDGPLVKEYEKIIANIDLPPVLPRFAFDDAMANMKAHADQIDQQLEQYTWSNIPEEEIAKHRIDLNAVEEQLILTTTQFYDGYLEGAHFIPEARSPHPGKEAAIYAALCSRQGSEKDLSGDYAYVSFDNRTFSNRNLTRSYFEYAEFNETQFIDCDLSSCVFAHTTFVGAKFENCIFDKSNLGLSEIKNCTFINCSFTNAIFAEAKIENSSFQSCKFDEGMMLFMDTKVVETEYLDCIFKSLSFLNLDLRANKFDRSLFHECHFVKPQLEATSFRGTKFQKSNFVEATGGNMDFSHADIENIRFLAGCSLPGAVFDHSTMPMSCFIDADITGASFRQADVSQANFGNAIAKDTDFTQCTGLRSVWNNTDLCGAKFHKSNLLESSFYQSKLQSVEFNSANLYSANFLYATLGETKFTDANLELTILKDWQPA